MFVPRWEWEAMLRNQRDIDRRVKRLELMLLKDAQMRISGLSDASFVSSLRDSFLSIEEIINESK
ncbi:hypothetical protein ACTQ6A_01655 [Lachnospiraceae bacterium LCP25S3_G4]